MKKEEDIVREEGVKAVLFDLDGVIINSKDYWFYCFNDTLAHFRFKKIAKTEFNISSLKLRFTHPLNVFPGP